MPWQHSIIIIISHAFLHVLHSSSSSSTTSVYHYHRHHHHHQYHHQQLFFLFLFIILDTAHSLIHYPLDHTTLPLVVKLLLLFFLHLLMSWIKYDNFQSNFLPQHGSKSCHYPLHILTCTVLMAVFPGKWLSIGFHIPINTLCQPSTSYNTWMLNMSKPSWFALVN